jgi:predicted nucleotidyltransferase
MKYPRFLKKKRCIGALAVAYHGVVRASLDADALITFKGAHLDQEELTRKLNARGWNAALRVGEDDDPLGFVIRITDASSNQVDLIGGIRRLEAGFYERNISAEIDGFVFQIASSEDLIALKIFAGSPKDLEDVEGIVQVMGTALKRDFALSLCRRFGISKEKLCLNLFAKYPV